MTDPSEDTSEGRSKADAMARQPIQKRNEKAQARTKRWREARTERRVPEARQVDRAILLALTYWTRAHGPVIDFEKGDMTEILRYAIKVLARRNDEEESLLAVQDRMSSLVQSREIDDILRREETRI